MANLDVFQQLRIAIADGTYREKFPVSTLLPDVWTDPETGAEYVMPHRIMDYRVQKLADDKEALGATLCRVNTLPEPMKFDEKKKVFFGLSSLKEYLNSDYLIGCSSELRKSIAEVEISESHSDDSRMVHCKVFIPNPEELHYNVMAYSRDMVDQLSWEYFRDTHIDGYRNCEKRVFHNSNNITQSVWTRSYTHNEVGYVLTDGRFYFIKPSSSHGVLPTSIIVGADVKL